MNRFIIINVLIGLFIGCGAVNAKPYRGAEYRTKDTFLYGRFEVRMKSAQVSGMLSSFFTYHEISDLQDWNEIDIEILGLHSGQVQFNTITPGQTNHVHDFETRFNPHQAFHVYAMEWTPDYVAWYVDSVEVYRQTGDHIQTLNRRQKLMMNIWQPNYPDWVGTFDAGDLPAFAFYDWIQYYSYTPQADDRFTLQWRDDLDDWDQSRWAKATHTWDGNNSQFVHDNVVFQDGYMVLCLTMPEDLGYDDGPVVDEDVDAPYVTSAWFYNNAVEIHFSEPLDRQSALNPEHYIMPAFGDLQNLQLLNNDQTVRFTVEGRKEGVLYNLVVQKVQDKQQHTMTLQQLNVGNTPFMPFHVNVAGPEQDSYAADEEWNATTAYGYSGGQTVSHGQSITFDNTDEDVIYRSERRQLNHYQIKLPNDRYDVTLMFAETEFTGNGQRVMDVYGEGRLLIDDLDIFEACGSFTACERRLTELNITDQSLDLYFEAQSGTTVLSGIKIQRSATAIDRSSLHLPQNPEMHLYPNPFNPLTTVQYHLPRPSKVKIAMYDTVGRLIKTLVHQQHAAGSYNRSIRADNLGSGVYFVTLLTDGQLVKSRKAVIIK
ncbi:MAG: family 16 glycosylhydrolase [Caldithrix sp.]|nr:family 16 glycosylhydrolase [Caldithrix sp.]